MVAYYKSKPRLGMQTSAATVKENIGGLCRPRRHLRAQPQAVRPCNRYIYYKQTTRKMYICESMGIEYPGGKTSGSSSRTTKIINQMFFRVAAAPWKPPLSTILASSRPVEATTNSTILASSRPAYSLPSVKPYLQPHCQFDRDMNWQARPLHVFGL